MPDAGKAKAAAGAIFQLVDSVSEIDPMSETGDKEINKGTIQIKGLHFTYPSRPDSKILNGLNLTIEEGKVLALVGHSGCGKSSIVALLERFYEPQSGEILLGGVSVKNINIKTLRQSVRLLRCVGLMFCVRLD
jgi:ATP-binding cassette subfamily B (MDR/TAP) protein 1